jgi:hypothetical protein
MRTRTSIFLTAAALILGALPSIAHHAFNAEFDRNKPVTVTGTVTKVEWMNPHARFYVDEKRPDGTVVNWDFELGSPNILMRRGWSRHTLKEGDVVTVTGWAAKNASHVANSGTVTKDGKRLFSGSSNPEAEQ